MSMQLQVLLLFTLQHFRCLTPSDIRSIARRPFHLHSSLSVQQLTIANSGEIQANSG